MDFEKSELPIANKWYIICRYILDIFTLGTLFTLIIQLLSHVISINLPSTSNYIINTVIVCVSYLPFAFIAAYLACFISIKDILKKKNILKSYVPSIIKTVSLYILIVGIIYSLVSVSNAKKTYQEAVYNNPYYIEQEQLVYATNNTELISSFETIRNKSMENAQNMLSICIFSTKIIETLFYLISIKLTEKILLKFAYDDDLFEKDTAIKKYA